MPHTDVPWTRAMDDAIARAAAAGATAAAAGLEVGKSRSAVISHARKIGVRFLNGSDPWTPEMDVKLMKLVAKGLTSKECGEQLGKSKEAVHGHIRTLRKRLEMKARNQNSKYSEPKIITPAPAPLPTLRRVMTPEDRKQIAETIGVGENLPMETLRETSCRYPVSETTPFTFCGRTRKQGWYCKDHWQVTHPNAPLSRL